MLEHRNDTFKTTAAQSQVKVLQLEQEKVAASHSYNIAMIYCINYIT